MKISPIWRTGFRHFAVCLGPASMILGIAIALVSGNNETILWVLLFSLCGTGVAALIGVFTGRVLAFVLGALAFFITAITIPGMLRACCGSGTEANAIGSMRSINSAQSTYSYSCGGNGYAQSLEDLIKPPAGSTAGFIYPDLSSNGVIKSGYVVTLSAGPEAEIVTPASQTCNGATAPAMSSYFAEAHPVEVGKTGQRSFATDKRGTVYFNNTGERIRPDMSNASVLQ
jgi:hypothetical protein